MSEEARTADVLLDKALTNTKEQITSLKRKILDRFEVEFEPKQKRLQTQLELLEGEYQVRKQEYLQQQADLTEEFERSDDHKKLTHLQDQKCQYIQNLDRWSQLAELEKFCQDTPVPFYLVVPHESENENDVFDKLFTEEWKKRSAVMCQTFHSKLTVTDDCGVDEVGWKEPKELPFIKNPFTNTTLKWDFCNFWTSDSKVEKSHWTHPSLMDDEWYDSRSEWMNRYETKSEEITYDGDHHGVWASKVIQGPMFGFYEIDSVEKRDLFLIVIKTVQSGLWPCVVE
jgi:hypothetical protein